jgi:hypothetical protein
MLFASLVPGAERHTLALVLEGRPATTFAEPRALALRIDAVERAALVVTLRRAPAKPEELGAMH